MEEIMARYLVIVESPAKVKTIKKFLGSNYVVTASNGHVRDMPKSQMGIDIENDYEPKYITIRGKGEILAKLRKEVKKADKIYLATDPDREGEAISWHLSKALKLENKKFYRISFNEITKNAVKASLKNPREIDMDLVDAQQARRVLDRIVGYKISPLLWAKVKRGLSAGRVQSVALRIIADREEEIDAFIPEEYWTLDANLKVKGERKLLTAKFYGTEKNKVTISSKEELDAIVKEVENADYSVADIKKGERTKKAPVPFTTSTLQQEASKALNFATAKTMRIAQQLYEGVDIKGSGTVGLITYLRTDSTRISEEADAAVREYIKEGFGEEYVAEGDAKKTSDKKIIQDAHEAIRPTYISNDEISGTAQEKRLYELIRKRTIACQMADAELERTTISVGIGGKKEKFVATGEVITFDGFLQVYRESFDDENEKEQENGLLPPVTLNEVLSMKDIVATERFTQRPPRYTEASLVRRLEELGIGRPSTYAPTIQTIQNREYVVKGDKEGTERTYNIVTLAQHTIKEVQKTEIVGADRNKLMPTDIGTVVNDFLMEYFPGVMDYNFTASVEKEFDAVAEGEMVWTDAIDKFYKLFHPIVEEAASVRTEHKVGERELGIDPKSGKPVFVKIGRYGPVVQIGQAHPEDKEAPKPQFATLMKGQSIETITLEEALKLFDLPRTIGEYEGKVMVAAVGRFGPFIRHDGKFVSIPKGLNPLSITAEEAIELIEAKKQKDEQRFIKKFDEDPEMEILNGRFGPYISYKKKNYRIPKTIEKPENLTLEECQKIIAEAGEKPAATKKRTTRKKA